MINFILKLFGLVEDFNEIIPNIYIGNYKSSLDNIFLQKYEIKLIINCTKNFDFNPDFKFKKIRIPIDDNRIFKNNDLLKYLNFLDTIHLYKKNKQNILIHCNVGSQRSPNILLLYLTRTLNIPFHIAYQIIKQKRPICFFPLNNFNHIFFPH